MVMLSVTDFEFKNPSLISSDSRIVLAYSGGLDSSVLLHLLTQCIEHHRLVVWHINHGLQNCAADMESFCRQQTQLKQLQFNVSHLNLSHLNSNIEAQARDARYRIFANELDPKNDILLSAHHADDQLETLLLNMARGTGVSGLRGIGASIDVQGISTLRPLLSYSRNELEHYAVQHDIAYFEDPTNVLKCFDRNFIRHDVAPQLKKRWPSINQSFRQVGEHQKEAWECLQELAVIDDSSCSQSNQFSQSSTLNIPLLKKLSFVRQKNLIRYWLKQSSSVMNMHQLNLLIQVIGSSNAEFKQIDATNGFIALFNNALFCVSKKDLKSNDEVVEWLRGKEEPYVSRFNKKEKGITGHFLKRQFQAKKIPPWLRDQTIFQLENKDSKHVIKTIVL